MKELSLHILDVAENSLRAKSTLIEINIFESTAKNTFEMMIKDDGCGMSEEYAQRILDPFVTERTTRKVGMGIPLFAATAESANGELRIKSSPGKGTTIWVVMERDHIDRPPLGDIATTVTSLICNEDSIDVVFVHQVDNHKYTLDTREIKENVGDLPLCTSSVISWINDYVNENEIKLREEIDNEISS